MKRLAVFLLLIIVGCKGEAEKEETIETISEETVNKSVVEEEVYHQVESYNPDDFEKVILDLKYFQNKVFDIGPSVEVNKCEIVAECDCCQADLITFDNDFYYVSYCLDENTYLKGTFEVDEGRLLLLFEDNYVSEYFSIESGDNDSELKIEKREDIDITELKILKCNDKKMIYLQFDEGGEFGLLTTTNNIDYIENLKKENTNLWLTFVNL